MTSEPTITVELTEDRGVLDRLDRIERTTRLAAAVTLTVEDAAAVIGCGPELVYALIHRGELAAIRNGRRLLIPRASIEAWAQREAV